MGIFILRRLGMMILTALCLTFIVFWLTNLYPNLEKLAKTQGNQRMSDEAVTSWLDKNGYLYRAVLASGTYLCAETFSAMATLVVDPRTVITNRRITVRVSKN